MDKNTLTFFFKKKKEKKTDTFQNLLLTLSKIHSPLTLSLHSFSQNKIKPVPEIAQGTGNGTGNRTRTRRGTGFLFFFLFYKYTLSFMFFISSSKYCVDVFTFMSDWIWKLSENVDRFLGFWRGTVENCSIGFYEKR